MRPQKINVQILRHMDHPALSCPVVSASNMHTVRGFVFPNTSVQRNRGDLSLGEPFSKNSRPIITLNTAI